VTSERPSTTAGSALEGEPADPASPEPGGGPAEGEQASREQSRRASRGLGHPALSLPAVGYVALWFLVPLGVLVLYSFWPTENGQIVQNWTFDNYQRFFTESIYASQLFESFRFAGLCAALTVVFTFPFAYFVALRAKPQHRLLWILVAIVPFFTSYLIRVFAWLNLFGDTGIINEALTATSILESPLGFFGYDRPAIAITFIYLMFPLGFLTSYISLERIDPTLLEGAADLGAPRHRALLRITLPLARYGLLAGFAFCLITMLGDYATPQLIGGTQGLLYANLMINQFGISQQWGFGATLALLLLATVFLVLLALRAATGSPPAAGEYTRRFVPQRTPFLRAYAIGFLLFLYAPIALLVAFSFNTSETIGLPFEGFTFRWFGAIFDNQDLLDALFASMRIAVISVGLAVAIGTIAAIALSRSVGRIKSLSISVIALPLFLPPVILGIGIIIALNAANIQRGTWTIVAGHLLLVLPIVTLLVLVRLQGMDRSQELAAADLGARPTQALLRVVVPQALPAIVGSALIGFAISMDEFILTFLVTGTTATLPLYIYSSLRFVISPELTALSSLMIAASFVLIVAGALIIFGRGRRTYGTAINVER
jgi:spermidine/putrescine transport system permease protein